MSAQGYSLGGSRRFWAATFLVVAAAFAVTVAFSGPASAGSNGKTTICHATGSATKPWIRISVSDSSLDHHRTHQGGRDIIPAPTDRNCGEPEEITDPVDEVTDPVIDPIDDLCVLLGCDGILVF